MGMHVIRTLLGAVPALGLCGCLAIIPAASDVPETQEPASGAGRAISGRPLSETAVAFVNGKRRAQDLSQLSHDPLLDRVAKRHARDMRRTGRLDHVDSDGKSPHERLKTAGYGPCLTAENIGRGYPDLQAALSGWMKSRPHRRNILLPEVREFGLGHDPAGPTWVMMLARPGC